MTTATQINRLRTMIRTLDEGGLSTRNAALVDRLEDALDDVERRSRSSRLPTSPHLELRKRPRSTGTIGTMPADDPTSQDSAPSPNDVKDATRSRARRQRLRVQLDLNEIKNRRRFKR